MNADKRKTIKVAAEVHKKLKRLAWVRRTTIPAIVAELVRVRGKKK